jgi:hypothetical protein
MGSGPDEKKRRPTPAKAFWGRFALGHFLAYPVCFLTAVGAMPFGMMLKRDALLSPERVGASSSIVRDVARDLKLSGIEAAQVEMVLEFAMWVCLAVLLVVHLAALPWSFAAAAAVRHPEQSPRVKRGLRIFGATLATTVVTVALAGTAGWIWIMTR